MSNRNPAVLGKWGPNGTRVVASEAKWCEPLKWNKAAAKAGERHQVFCASLADVFEDWSGQVINSAGEPLWATPDGCLTRWIADYRRPNPDVRPLTLDRVRFRLFDLIAKTPHLDWLLLSKRPENFLKLRGRAGFAFGWDLMPNVWLGVSVENQRYANERIRPLLDTPAAVRFLSVEPLLGPIDLGLWRVAHPKHREHWPAERVRNFWVITGGESGPGARPAHPDWFRSIRDQCQEAGVPYFHKQNGEWLEDCRPTDADEIVRACLRNPGGCWLGPHGESTHEDWDTVRMSRVGKKAAGRLLDGRIWAEFPNPLSGLFQEKS